MSRLARDRAAGSRPSLYLCDSEHGDRRAPDIFARLSGDEGLRLMRVSTVMRFGAGDDVFRQGESHEGIFIILSGQVCTYYMGPSGRELTLAYWEPGNFVGGPEIFGRGPHMWSGRATAPTQVLQVRAPELRCLMEQIPALAIALVEALEHKGKCYTAMIHMLGTRSASERLAQLLVLMAERDGRRRNRCLVISRRLTHEELAKMIGATRQWVTATLERFATTGIITVSATCIVILDEQRLRRFAHGASDGTAGSLGLQTHL